MLHNKYVLNVGAFTERAATLATDLRAACAEAEASVKRDFETLVEPYMYTYLHLHLRILLYTVYGQWTSSGNSSPPHRTGAVYGARGDSSSGSARLNIYIYIYMYTYLHLHLRILLYTVYGQWTS